MSQLSNTVDFDIEERDAFRKVWGNLGSTALYRALRAEFPLMNLTELVAVGLGRTGVQALTKGLESRVTEGDDTSSECKRLSLMLEMRSKHLDEKKGLIREKDEVIARQKEDLKVKDQELAEKTEQLDEKTKELDEKTKNLDEKIVELGKKNLKLTYFEKKMHEKVDSMFHSPEKKSKVETAAWVAEEFPCTLRDPEPEDNDACDEYRENYSETGGVPGYIAAADV